MNDETTNPAPPKPKRPARRVRRHRPRVFGVWVVLSILFLSGIFFLGALSVSGRTVNAPQWATDQVVARMNASMSNGRVSLGRLGLAVNERGVPRILLRNLGIFDNSGAEIGRLNDVGARFSLSALLRGQLQPQVLRLSGAQMTLRRRADGQFALSFGDTGGATGTLPGVLDAIDELFTAAPLAEVTALEAGALTITLEDGRTGRIWQVTDGQMTLRKDAGALDISIAFDVFNGTEELARTILGIRTDRSNAAATLGATFENAAAADIALQSPVLSFLGVLDAPISGAVRAEFNGVGTLETLAGTLEVGKGALQPSPATRPISFDSGKAYFAFDPSENQLNFSEITISTGAASVVGSGHAYLQEFQQGWPSVFLGQFSTSDLRISPEGMFEEEVAFSQGAVDFRLRLDPFTMEVGQAVLQQEDEKLIGSGTVRAGPMGWEISADLEINKMDHARALSLWPVVLAPKTRLWLGKNILDGQLNEIYAAARVQPGSDPRFAVGFQFSDATVKYIPSMPNLTSAKGFGSIYDKTFSLMLEGGQALSPSGSPVDMTGSSMRVEDVTLKPATAQFNLASQSSVMSLLGLLNEPPFNILQRTNLAPDFADGAAQLSADVAFEMKKPIALEDVDFIVSGTLGEMQAPDLVPNRTLAAQNLQIYASPQQVDISGPVQIGTVPANLRWTKVLGQDQTGQSTIEGTIELSQAFADEFSIGLPAGTVSGKGLGQLKVNLTADAPATFTLNSDLDNIGLSIPPLGWRKPAAEHGKLVVEGTLGSRPNVTRLDLSATGLNAAGGRVSLTDQGQLQTATFSRVTAGGWLDAPVVLTGRGAGVPPAVSVQGGTIDVRQTAFGQSNGAGSGRNSGPINLALDRLIVSEGISLTSFDGEFDSSAGIAGRFTARVNGNTPVSGRLAPESRGTAIRLQSADAGGALRDAGVLQNARGGALDLTLRPQGFRGVYEGRLTVGDTRIVGAPALTELLSAISIVGLLDQVNGPGIAFADVEADFRLSPRAVTLTRSSAVGPSLGISLDGIYDLGSGLMDMQGVISPVYFLNGIGQIFSRRGEGLFGFTFQLAGAADNPQVKVNPLSILTPGMFRELFRKAPPTAAQTQ